MNLAKLLAAPSLSNPEAEAELLGWLLRDNTHFDMIADALEVRDFYEPYHQRVYMLARAIILQAEGREANPVTLAPYCRDDKVLAQVNGAQYLLKLTGLMGTLSPQGLVKQIRELAVRRRAREKLTEAIAKCSELDEPLQSISALADAAVPLDTNREIVQMQAYQAVDEFMKYAEEPTGGVQSMRIPAMDDALGSIAPKNLVILGGRPGMAKTATALSYGMGVALQGQGCLFVSLEMSARELAGRLLADACCYGEGDGVDYGLLQQGPRAWSDRDRARVQQEWSRMRELPLHIIDVGMLSTGRLRALIMRHARRLEAMGTPLRLVIVDYLQLLSADERQGNRYEEITYISRALKGIAKDMDVGIMALAQLSRKVEERNEKIPQLSDLRDSGQIEQDADSVMFLYRPAYYEPEAAVTQGFQHDLHFIAAKRRGGVTGTQYGKFYGQFQAVR
jgi:replicative DNA helicase